MFLSVIVPIYNAESTLTSCIESILQQKVERMEIILVDDGSSDMSYKIADEFLHNYPKTIRLHKKENGGEASARNLGLSLARGKYVSFVDNDDIIKPDYYKTIIDRIFKCVTEPDLVITGCTKLEDGIEYPKPCKSEFVSRQDFADNIFWWRKQADLNVVWNKFFRRELIEDLSFEKRINATDQIFCLNVFTRVSNVLFVDTCGYVQWMNPNSITHRLSRRYDPIYELESSCNYREKTELLYKKIGVSEKQLFQEYCRNDYVWFYVLIKNLFNEGTPYDTNKKKEDRIKEIMMLSERRRCILQGPSKSKLSILCKILYCINSPRIVRLVFKHF